MSPRATKGPGGVARRLLRLAAIAAVAALAAGCGRTGLHGVALGNQRPIARLTETPASSGSTAYYAYQIEWTGFDPDGSVDHFLYCVDPPKTLCTDTPWVATRVTRQMFLFPATGPDSLGSLLKPRDYHVFVLKAVDNRNLESAPAIAAFTSSTVAPTVQLLQPRRVSALIMPELPPTTTFVWTGTDPDGFRSKFPVYYKYKVFSKAASAFDYNTILLHPDSLRIHYAPDFAGWDSIAGDTCRVTTATMTPGAEAVLAVVAFDEVGAYSPVFTFDGNLLRFTCSYTGQGGPVMSVWNDYFNYTRGGAAYSLDPETFLHIEVPAGTPITFNWSAVAHTGTYLLGFRWAMDLASIDDPTQRSDEATDWTHWSARTLANRATVGPFVGTGADSLEQHTFYIEAEDWNHLKSLVVVVFRVLRNTYARPLLVVDDTRLTPDRTSNVRPDSVLGPTGTWPTAAELDTFLFARGGMHWRFYVPTTTLSRPGILNGYDFDTLGTRSLRNGTMPLSVLSSYRQVLWMCDPAVDYTLSPDNPRLPMPVLRAMSAPGHFNALTAFSEMGGGLWLMGGGIAYNSLLPWNVTTNDINARWPYTAFDGMVFSDAAGELAGGRLLYHTAHWRGEIRLDSPAGATLNPDLPRGGPEWALLPPLLQGRTPATDPLPPLRSNAAQFYLGSYNGELLNKTYPMPGLDTLYSSTYGKAGPHPVMTSYHGPEGGPTVYSGFPLWYFQRAQAIQVADYVLQTLWHMPRRAVAR